jgi:hypothetical protein
MSYSSLSAEELVRACSESGNAEAWEEFVRRFRVVIGSAVRRVAYSYGKSNSAVGIVDAESCNKDGKLNLLLDTADTSVGASGALVLDVYKTIDHPRRRPLALGLHKCCDAFFGTVNDYDQPEGLNCAVLERTPNNQDVTSNSIIKDPTLCYYLRAHSAWKSDDDGNESPVSCTEP